MNHHIITYEQIASTLDPVLVCEIGGGHRWDIQDGRIVKSCAWSHPVYWYSKIECFKCGAMEDSPWFDKARRKLDRQARV